MLLVVGLLTLLSAALAHKNPHYVSGHGTMVHLFEWKWLDIATECEQFLGPMGYGGVQVSPIQENVIIEHRPWFERYQPISYLWNTRSGTAKEFRDMVRRCNDVGVRIYVDAVFNHMTGNHAVPIGTGGSHANTYQLDYPAVPFSSKDFHSYCAIDNYQDPRNVRDCELVGLHDLNQTTEYVRKRIVDFMNEAIDAGVAGFRIDAAKHMWPNDLKIIYSRVKNLNAKHGFPENASPYIFQEVIDMGGEGVSKYEYNEFAAVTEFKHGYELSNAMRGNNPLKWFKSWGEAWGLIASKDALVFVDNHDTQRSGDNNILTYKSSKQYKMAVAFMLAHPYGTPRVMSSFDFRDFNQGPPSDSEGNILSPIINADGTCANGWICEHRWRQIYNMVRFRNAVNDTELTGWWDNGGNQIAFCRGDVGFVAFNAERNDLKATIHTCLPPGTYCDVISGSLVNRKCTGKVVRVDNSKNAYVEILSWEEDGVLAIHAEARLI